MSHTTPNPSRPWPLQAARRGFTIIEMVMSVLVLGLLISLLIVGVRKARSTVQKTVDEGTVHSLMMAVVQFKKDYGFLPPLVKDNPTDSQNPASGPRLAQVEVFSDRDRPRDSPRNGVFLCDAADTQDVPILQGSDTPNASNPFADVERFSVTTIPIYLVGALKAYYGPSDPTGPIDGVVGPGFYTPATAIRPDGKVRGVWNVPLRKGNFTPPLINLGGSALKLVTSDSDAMQLTVQDRNGIPIRYYRWVSKPGSSPDALKVLRVPPMVARDATLYPATPPSRDLALNAQVRGAHFAIVAAGQNKVFGDESIDELRRVLSNNSVTDDELRRIAEADNIVEVGE